MDGLIQWRGVAGANIQIFSDVQHAGGSRCTIVVPDMDEARRVLDAIGISLAGEREGDYGKIAQIKDPDGNLVTLAEPPTRGQTPTQDASTNRGSNRGLTAEAARVIASGGL